MRIKFFVAEKDRNYGIAEAMAEGAKVHGDEVEVIPQGLFQGPCDSIGACLGVKKAGKRLLAAHLDAGCRFLFLDKSYMARAQHLRISIDAWQPTAYFQSNRPPDRFERLGLEVRPLSCKGNEILFAGSSQKYCNFNDLGDATEYATRVVAELKKGVKMQHTIVYRPKPSWAAHHPEECLPIEGTRLSAPRTPIKDELARCHLLVTHGSNAAVDALLEGVPIMALGSGIFDSMSMGEDYARIETPFFPTDEERMQFFYDLAYCQWTLEEFRSGAAWADLRQTIVNLGPPGGLASPVDEAKIAHRGRA